MAKTRLSPKATFVERGYGQVEPNHMSAQRNGQIYAQLPAAANINLLENGQFVKYNYKDGVVDFSGKGEWMLVFNEVKVYREWETDCDFAMIKDNYNARIYSPIDGTLKSQQLSEPRYYGGTRTDIDPTTGNPVTTNIPKVTTPADPYEWDSTDNPFQALFDYGGPKAMPANTKMVPRVFKTMVGDIYTTNTIKLAQNETLSVGDELVVDTDGYLKKSAANANNTFFTWQVVKVYDLGDQQAAVKIMRIN